MADPFRPTAHVVAQLHHRAQRLAPTRISRPGCASSPALVRRQRPPGPERRPRAGSRGERLRRHRARLPGRRHRGDLRLQVAGLYRELFYTACRRRKRDAAVLPRGPRYRPRGGRIAEPGPSRRTPLTASWPRPSKTAPSAPPTTVPIATGPPRSRLPAYTTSPIDSDRSRAPRLERELAEAERTVTAAARIAASPPSGARTSKPKSRTAGDPAPIYSATRQHPARSNATSNSASARPNASSNRVAASWPTAGPSSTPSFAYLRTFSHLDWGITMATGFAHSSCAETSRAMDLPTRPDDALAQPTRAKLFSALNELRRPVGTAELAERFGFDSQRCARAPRAPARGGAGGSRTDAPGAGAAAAWSIAPDAPPGGDPPSAYADLGRWLSALTSGRGGSRAHRGGWTEDRPRAGAPATARPKMHAALGTLGFAPRREADGAHPR